MSESRRMLEQIHQTRVIVVVRGNQTSGVCSLAGQLATLGLDVHEITLTTPGALACIEEMRSKYPDLLVGAGTVLDAQNARDAIAAGAQFLVSPTLDHEVVEIAKSNGALAIPGSLTPTEAHKAWCAGADIVKIFPASIGGPSYIRALKGPMPDLHFISTGGITVENAVDYLKAGSYAVCLGTSFIRPEALISADYRETLAEAKRLMALLNDVHITA